MAPEKLLKVIENNLCVRCGACVGICPHECLSLDQNNFPTQKYQCSNECNLCLRVCPGLEVNFPKLTHQIFKKRYDVTNPLGIFQNVLVGHSTNIEIREKATSGGIITQLLIYLLKQKEINGAIVTIADPNKPWKAKPILAMNKDQIMESAQSKYCISPVNQLLRQLRNVDGKYAFVGLPCHVHAIRKLMQIYPSLGKKVSPIIGLYCSMTLETEASTDLIEFSKIPSSNIQKVEFRSGKWPGSIKVKTKNGTLIKLHKGHIKDVYPILQRLYYPKRCMCCIDGSNELSDISVADPWIKNKKGKYPYPNGSSLVIVRTGVGKEILDRAQKDSALFLEEIKMDSFVDFNLSMMKKKRRMAFFTMERLKRKRIPIPTYRSTLLINNKERFNEQLVSLPFYLGKFKLTRKLALLIALSPIGYFIKKVSDILKQKRSS